MNLRISARISGADIRNAISHTTLWPVSPQAHALPTFADKVINAIKKHRMATSGLDTASCAYCHTSAYAAMRRRSILQNASPKQRAAAARLTVMSNHQRATVTFAAA